MRTTRYHGRSALIRFARKPSTTGVVSRLCYEVRGPLLDGATVRVSEERFSIVMLGLPFPTSAQVLKLFVEEKVEVTALQYRTSAVHLHNTCDITGIGWITCTSYEDGNQLVAKLNGETFEGAGPIAARWNDCNVPEYISVTPSSTQYFLTLSYHRSWGLVECSNGAPHPVFGSRESKTSIARHASPNSATVQTVTPYAPRSVCDNCTCLRIVNPPPLLTIVGVVEAFARILRQDVILGVAAMDSLPSRKRTIVITLSDRVHVPDLLHHIVLPSSCRIVPCHPFIEIGFLPDSTTKSDIMQLLESEGVQPVEVAYLGKHKRGRTFAYIQLSKHQDCQAVISRLDQALFDGVRISVEYCMDDRALFVSFCALSERALKRN